MYILTKEDKSILTNYREYLINEVAHTENEEIKMILGKSVELLNGEITSKTLANYLEVQVKKSADVTANLSDATKQKINETRIAANKHGVMEVVKRFKQGS